jgi:predicted MFS family arabinose efflux permease
LIIGGLGYDKYTTSLLNMPFGAVQTIVILLASYLAQTARLKGAILAIFMLPVVAGLAILYAVPRAHSAQGTLLAGYYLLAFLFGGNPLVVTWIVGNTAGSTKKSVAMSLYNAASSAGNIVGPLLFTAKDAPEYHPGLRACLAIFCAMAAVVLLQWANLWFLNKQQARRRVRNGKSAQIIDHSMQTHFHGIEETPEEAETGQHVAHAGAHVADDLTDRQNDEFVYIY